jgi:hypothetical protein
MRIFAFLMAILIVFLNAVPCADAAPLNNKATTEIAKHANETSNPFNDACSPFCQCSCCAGFSINYHPAGITLATVAMEKSASTYITPSILEVSNAIWQPPRSNS